MYETACQLTCDSHESPRDPVPIVFCPCIPGSTNHTDLELHPSIKRKSNPQAISGLHKNCEHACYSALVAVKLEGLGTIAPTVLPTLQAMGYKPSQRFICGSQVHRTRASTAGNSFRAFTAGRRIWTCKRSLEMQLAIEAIPMSRAQLGATQTWIRSAPNALSIFSSSSALHSPQLQPTGKR
jgi:hypothetical protein